MDFEKQLIHIRRTYSKQEYKFRDYPKGKKHHSVCIPFELLNLLEQESSKATGELFVQPTHYKMPTIAAPELEKVARQIRLFPSGTKMKQNGVIGFKSFRRGIS